MPEETQPSGDDQEQKRKQARAELEKELGGVTDGSQADARTPPADEIKTQFDAPQTQPEKPERSVGQEVASQRAEGSRSASLEEAPASQADTPPPPPPETQDELAQERAAWEHKQKWGYENPPEERPRTHEETAEAAPESTRPEHEVAREEHVDHDDSLQSLRTYKRDVANAVKQEKQSASRIALAEKKRARKRKEEGRARNTTITRTNTGGIVRWIGIGAVILLVVGGAAGGGWYYYTTIYSTTDTETPSQPDTQAPEDTLSVRSFFTPDTYRTVPIADKTRAQARTAVRNALTRSGPVSQVVEVVPVTGTANSEIEVRKMPQGAFATLWSSAMPVSLRRALEDTYMLGTYTTAGTHPFLILRTPSFSQGYAGLLAWESGMPEDIDRLFGTNIAQATTTRFRDEVVADRDARAMRNANQEIELLYTLPRDGYTIIATHEGTVEEILERLQRSQN